LPDNAASVTPSLAKIALACRCPRCGQGALFQGLLKVRDRCDVCGLDLRPFDTGDGPVALVVLVLGTIVVVMAFWVEFHFSPPLWVHAVLWPIVTVPLALLLIRPMKAAFVAVQYRHMSETPPE
jgi:uncharacterized protein (DUF983 family)